MEFRILGEPRTLVFARSDADETILCAVNTGDEPVELPFGELLLASAAGVRDALPPDTAAWLREERGR